MLSAVHPARYDLPWKTALRHAFRDFVRFFFPELSPEIDWSKRVRFRDKELAGLSFAADTDSMVADKLVEVSLRDGRMQWVLIHVEVQAQRDAKLLDFAGRMAELETAHNPFALVTLAHLRTQRTRHDPAQLYAAKWQLTRLLFQHRWRKARIIALFKVINWMMVLPEALQRRYWQAVVVLEKESKMEWLTPLEQMFLNDGIQKGLKQGLEQGLERGLVQGLEQGLVQGREQGRREGALALLERQIARRFGAIPHNVHGKLARGSLQQLAAWSDAVPEAASLKDVFK